MLDVVTGIREDRIRNGRAMAVLTGNSQGHITGSVMIDVMGKEVKRRTVINVAMTTGTVTTTGTAGSCCYQAVVVGPRIRMTGGTGIMDRVVSRIY